MLWLLTAADTPPQVGDELPGADADGTAWLAYPDPRRICVEPPLQDVADISLPGIITENRVRLVQVESLGIAQEDDDSAWSSDDGWRIIAIEPTLARLFGPHGDTVLELVHRLDTEPDLAGRLVAAENDIEPDVVVDYATAQSSPEEVLCGAGIDGVWLAEANPEGWTTVIPAVAAADLLRPTAFELLIDPWRQATGASPLPTAR